jgi:CHAT domain
VAQTLPADGSDPVAEAARALRERRELAAELAETLNRIREQDGFASFGLPPANDELFAEAARGPVVTLNVGQHRSDALVLTESRVIPVELPGLSYDGAADQVDTFTDALEAATGQVTGIAENKAANESLREVLEWLWDAVAEPVLGALGLHSSRSSDEEWPQIWWVTGGLLSFLPIHAAGHHADLGNSCRRTVLDRIVSSYSPSIRALRYARQRGNPAASAGRSLIVAMPTTPGVPGRLHHVPAEAERLNSGLPLPVQLTEPGIPDQDSIAGSQGMPTKANVLALLPSCAIAHFACHSRSDPADPSRSLLLLHDHESDPLTVASLVPVKLDQAQLAYLSACRTAVTVSPELIDEAIHLTSAFQLAGFPHVVGTLWEIDDAIAVDIAGSFYASMQASNGTMETVNAARALHDAVRAARDKFPCFPSLWAAHLHAGA